jgi:hypothetical protein
MANGKRGKPLNGSETRAARQLVARPPRIEGLETGPLLKKSYYRTLDPRSRKAQKDQAHLHFHLFFCAIKPDRDRRKLEHRAPEQLRPSRLPLPGHAGRSLLR